jgi:Nuclear protein export factor
MILIVERGKISDLSKATVIQGTCQDMCPEKERYQRESRHQVALYEYQVDVSKVSKKFIQVRFFSLF